MFKFSTSSINNMKGVHPDLIKIANKAIGITWVDFGIPRYGGLRTSDIQKELFIEGVSRCDGIIKKSKHQEGLALDFFAYVNGKASWRKDYLTIIAAAFLQSAIELKIKIEWGGWWKGFPDMPHIQLIQDKG